MKKAQDKEVGILKPTNKLRRSTTLIALALGLSLLAAAAVRAGWFPETRLTFADHASKLSSNNARSMVSDSSGNTHLVWYDRRDGSYEIYYNYFDGAVWGTDTPLTSNGAVSEYPALAVDPSDHLHVVWVDLLTGTPEIHYKTFDGVSWGPAQALTSGSASSDRPSIVADALGHLHVVWRDYRDGAWGIFYKMFDGMSWSSDLRLTDPAGYPLYAAIATDDSMHLHVVWADYRDSNWEIYYKRFDGLAWGSDLRTTDDSDISLDPAVTVDTYGTVHVFWHDNRTGSFTIFHRAFDGITWGPDEQLVTPVTHALSPSVAAGDSGRLHLAWHDGPGYNTEIYYMAFDGIAWGARKRISDEYGPSENAKVAIDANGYRHIVWHDERQVENFEIYWRQYRPLPKPELTSIEPDSGYVHTDVHISDLAGNGFFTSPEVWLQMAGEDPIEASNVSLESSTRITCDFNLDDAALGWWDVVVQNIDLQGDTLHEGFLVVPFGDPGITSINPESGVAYTCVSITDLAGTAFAPQAEVWLQKSGEDNLLPSNLVVESITRITCDFDLGAVAAGNWDVVVTNPGGWADTLVSGFEVRPGAWGDDLRLTDDEGLSSTSQPNGRCIAVDTMDDLHIVWYDNRDGNEEIYYRKRVGAAWTAEERLTNAAEASANPAIAIDNDDRIHVVWDDYRDGNHEIYYKCDDGLGWSADLRLTNAAGESKYPSVAIGTDNRIYIVWQDKRTGESNIYFKMRDDSGWSPDTCIAPGINSSGTPAIAVDGLHHVHVVWYQDEAGSYRRLLYMMFDGVTWSPMEVLASEGRIYGPTVAVDNSNMVHVAWHHERRGFNQGYDIFYRRFNGLAWEPEVRITNSRQNSHTASIAARDSDDVHIVWADKNPTNNEIYYSAFDGDAWLPATRLTRAVNESKHPSLAIDHGGEVHLIWRDLRDDNYEIYYKQRDPLALAGVPGPETAPGQMFKIIPNPFETRAQIEFRLPSKAEVDVSVYDTLGRLVWKTNPVAMPAGRHHILWNGTGADGGRVAPGIYFLRLSAGIQAGCTKMVVVR